MYVRLFVPQTQVHKILLVTKEKKPSQLMCIYNLISIRHNLFWFILPLGIENRTVKKNKSIAHFKDKNPARLRFQYVLGYMSM